MARAPVIFSVAPLLIFTIIVARPALAGDAENIAACSVAAKSFANVTLNNFDASYEGNILTWSIAKWPNAYCEVKLGDVYTLQVNGKDYIYKGYAGQASYDLNSNFYSRTHEAILLLKTRISLLEERASQVSESLKKPNPDYKALTYFVDDGIRMALGSSAQPPAEASRLSPASPAFPPTAVSVKQADSNAISVKQDYYGTYFVKDNVLEVRIGPSSSKPITNRIYLRQKVEVYEQVDDWVRVSKYYDGSVEGVSGQVARWVFASGLSKSLPSEMPQQKTPNDPRIDKDAIPKVGEGGLTANDVDILYRGAQRFLQSGECSRIEFADKSTTKANTYYVNCGGPNKFFTPNDL